MTKRDAKFGYGLLGAACALPGGAQERSVLHLARPDVTLPTPEQTL